MRQDRFEGLETSWKKLVGTASWKAELWHEEVLRKGELETFDDVLPDDFDLSVEDDLSRTSVTIAARTEEVILY